MAGRFEGGAQPGAPAGFDPGAPLRDPAAALDQRDHVMREKLVKVAEARVRSRSPPPSLTPPPPGGGAPTLPPARAAVPAPLGLGGSGGSRPPCAPIPPFSARASPFSPARASPALTVPPAPAPTPNRAHAASA